MQFEKVIKYMRKNNINKHTGPRISYYYNSNTNTLTIASPRGEIAYRKELIDEPLYHDMLNYILYGKASERLKKLSGTDKPFISNMNEIRDKPTDNWKYDVIYVQGTKRRAALVNLGGDVYHAKLGPLELKMTKHYLDIKLNSKLIYSDRPDYEVLKNAVDFNLKKIAKRIIPFATEDYIVDWTIHDISSNRCTFVYDSPNKVINTTLYYDKRQCAYTVESVIYKEGIYSLKIPDDYNGPDPLLFTSTKKLPKEIKKRLVKKLPFKPKRWMKLANYSTHFAIIIGDYKLFQGFRGWTVEHLQTGATQVIPYSDFELLLELDKDETISVLSLLMF